jgi:uncharacterized SAM-binding protein YcdF (DUF218 family)
LGGYVVIVKMEDLYLILKSFVDPVFIVTVLLLIAFFTCVLSRKKNGSLITFLSLILLYGVSIAPTAGYLCYCLEKDYINKKAAEDKKIDIIIVLGGGTYDIDSSKDTFLSEATATRLLSAVEFYNRIGARYFVCAGRGTGRIAEAEVMAQSAQKLGIPKEKIRMDSRSQNTWEHAIELNKMFRDKNLTLGLVTSAYHLKRSEKEFNKYFNNVMPLAADYLYSSPSGPIGIRFIPRARSLYKTSIALNEIIGQLWYDIRGLY